MQFLKIVFWVLIAVLVTLFASRNWTNTTLNLWGDIQAEINTPLLVFTAFVAGWLPTWLILRARIWSLNRRIEALDRNRVAAMSAEPAPEAADTEPAA